MRKKDKNSKDSRNDQYRLRLNEEERAMLDTLSVETGENRSDILRRALKAEYNLTFLGRD